MKRKFIYLICCLTMLMCTKAQTPGLKAGQTVTAQVLSYDGNPVELAYVYPASMEQSKGVAFLPGQYIKPDKDGYFSYTSPLPLPFVIYITAAYHESFLLLIDSKSGKELHYEIRMARYSINKKGPFYILGKFNSFLPGKTPMKEIKPGVFEAEIETNTDSLSYLIHGLDRYLNLPGLAAALSRFTNISVKNGYYISKQKVEGGRAVINLDVSKYPTGSDKVQIISNDSYAESVALAFFDFNKKRDKYFRDYMAHIGSGKAAGTFIFDWLDYEQTIKKRILLNEYIGIEFLFYMAIGMMHAPVDTLLIKKVLTETDPESDYWQIYTLAIKWYEIIYDHDKAMNCLNLLFRNNNDAKIKSAALYYIIELQKKYNQPYENYYQQLLADFPQSTFAETAKDKYNPLGVFAKGRKIPAFSVRIMDSDAYFDTRQLKKKYYIIDFWATWCVPCIAELPELEKLYAKFKDRDLEIVSISIDKTKDAVKRFREKRFAMPWQHVVLDKGYDDHLLKALDIGSIPRIVLIDPRGVIIGSDDDLRNGKLDVLFSSILNGSYKN